MEGLIQSINRVQDVFASLGYDPIELPKIAVVGSQSAGKSSVLESLVSRSFLPRGTGIVTRCPLILQLIHCPLDDRRRNRFEDAREEWGEFLHAEGIIFNLDDICQEIEDRTEILAGSNKGICETPITLKIYSPKVVDLTLVDLPGITKVAVGDQPEDIEQQILNLLRHYIENPLCIILAVVTANTDMATNESLKVAKEFDSEGDRTLAVVTKLDLMDRGTTAHDMLSGNVIPVKLGIIAVKNRSQQDIIDNKSMEDALVEEAKFFETNYPQFASKSGTKYLGKALQRLLLNHIAECLPAVKAKIMEEILQCQATLEMCGDLVVDPKKELMNQISKFAAAYCSILEGGARFIDAPHLLGGAKICDIFNSKLRKDLMAIDPLKSYTLEKVLMVIKNSNGPRPPFFLSEPAFEALVKPEIKKLLQPSLACIDLVQQEMLSVVQDCFSEDIFRFPVLKQEIVSVVRKTIQKFLPEAKKMIKNLVGIEIAHITYTRLEFLKEESIQKIVLNAEEAELPITSLPFRSERSKSISHHTLQRMSISQQQVISLNDYDITQMPLQDKRHILIIGKMLAHYFDLVRETIQDTVPKSIMCFLVNSVKDALHCELTHNIYKEDRLDKIFAESESTASERKDASDKLVALDAALEILNEFVYQP